MIKSEGVETGVEEGDGVAVFVVVGGMDVGVHVMVVVGESVGVISIVGVYSSVGVKDVTGVPLGADVMVGVGVIPLV